MCTPLNKLCISTMLYFSNAKHSLRRGLQALAALTFLEMHPVLLHPAGPQKQEPLWRWHLCGWEGVLLITPPALAVFVRADDVLVTVEFFNFLFSLSLCLVAPASSCSNSESSSGSRLLRIQQDAVFVFCVRVLCFW